MYVKHSDVDNSGVPVLHCNEDDSGNFSPLMHYSVELSEIVSSCTPQLTEQNTD